jgi:hypothetical protein
LRIPIADRIFRNTFGKPPELRREYRVRPHEDVAGHNEDEHW